MIYRIFLGRTFKKGNLLDIQSESSIATTGELNGIKAREYLDKAKKLFREMDLQWDLEQLERLRADG